jgi:hypothetical protein
MTMREGGGRPRESQACATGGRRPSEKDNDEEDEEGDEEKNDEKEVSKGRTSG